MKPAPFDYVRPGSLDDALAALAGDPGAKVLAGGQSLVPLLSMRLAAPSRLVDINGLPGPRRHRGRAATASGSARSPGTPTCWRPTDVRRVQPLVSLALANVAHATIRNRGTTVGSIVHADAAAEMPMVLRLLGGSVEVAGPSGRRTIAADDLYVGPLESSLHHDEIAVSAFFPALRHGAGVAFEEIARRHGDYALCGVAALVTGETVSRRLPVGLRGADRRRPDRASPTPTSATRRSQHLDPGDDIHASADYRAQLVRVLTARVVAGREEDGSAA